MKTAVVSYPGSINLGDEVQSVAAMRLLEKVDFFIPREELNGFSNHEKVKLICNGWFMGNPDNWPPSPSIHPLFISMHITRSNGSYKKMLDKRWIEYYKQYEPIGCRDRSTARLFERIGVKSYFSNCLTLTLENEFEGQRGDKILLVDPFRHNYTRKYREVFEQQLVPEKYRHQVEVIRQRRKKIDATVEERFKDAEDLIEKYAKAKLVITSRIHCALPCLALGTPVYFVNAGYHSTLFNLNDRFEGITEMFSEIDESFFPFSSGSVRDRLARGMGLYKSRLIEPLPINWENPAPNSYDFSVYKNEMIQRVKEFINQD